MPDNLEGNALMGPPRFSRRQLLIGTSVAAVGAGAASVAGFVWLTQGPPIDLDALGAGPLSVGFVEGSGDRERPSRERWIEDGALAGSRVIPATAMRGRGDGLAGRLVRLTVHGLYPLDAHPRGSSLAVDAHIASPDPTAPYAFHAWMRRGGPAPSVSGRSHFQVLLDRDPRLAVTIETMTTTGMARTGALFGTRAGDGIVRLQRGAYLLGLSDGIWDRATKLPAAGDVAGAPASILLSVEPITT